MYDAYMIIIGVWFKFAEVDVAVRVTGVTWVDANDVIGKIGVKPVDITNRMAVVTMMTMVTMVPGTKISFTCCLS